MEHDPHLRRVLSDVAIAWNHNELYEALISLISNTKDEDLMELFGAELEEIGYLDPIEEDEA